jgi:hypothetical protein
MAATDTRPIDLEKIPTLDWVLKEPDRKIILARPKSGDWESMIVDGKIVAEGHSLQAYEVLDALGIEHESILVAGDVKDDDDAEEQWFDYIGQFPHLEKEETG